jgi:tyrosinase
MQAAKVLLALFGAAAAAPAAINTTCKDPVLRHEWRQLPEATRQSYLAAVKCLKTKPSRLGLTTPLYDDFPYVHARLATEGKSLLSPGCKQV